MKLIFISLALTITLINCELLVNNERQQNQESNRYQLEPSNRHQKLAEFSQKLLQLTKKETPEEKQKRRCDSCRESLLCKNYNKCDLCNKICKDLEIATEPPILGESLTETSDNSLPLFLENSDRYYTVGAFGPGPKQTLLARLLEISQKDKLEKLVVLAKANGQKGDNLDKPVIIDTASIFSNKKKPVVVKIDNDDESISMELASKIDRELDMAIQRKQKFLGESQLTKVEVDKIIEHALSLFDHSKIPRRNSINLQSRFNNIESEHLTTKRSIPPDHEPLLPATNLPSYEQGQSQNQKIQTRSNFEETPMNEKSNENETILTQAAPKDLINADDSLEDNFSDLPNESDQFKSINATQFTKILQSLERKVENIADLVKKTCGKADKLEDKDVVKSPLEIIDAPSDVPPAISQIEANNINPSTRPEIIQPQLFNKAIDELEKGTKYLIDKAASLTESLHDELLAPKSQPANILSLPKTNIPSNPQDPTVACSKEESSEYTGVTPPEDEEDRLKPEVQQRSNFKPTNAPIINKKPEDVACSKEDSEEYVAKQTPNKESKTEPFGAEKQDRLDQSPTNHDPEKVSCSKEESEEYVGEKKQEDANKEKVGCSKEEEEEDYVPMYVQPSYPYRQSEKQSEPKHGLPKHTPLLLPGLRNILENPPQLAPLRNVENPKADSLFKKRPLKAKPPVSTLLMPASPRGALSSAAHSNSENKVYEIPTTPEATVPSETNPPNARQFHFDTAHVVLPFQENAPFNRDPVEQNKPSPQPQVPIPLLPAFNQRLNNQEPESINPGTVGSDGFHVHRPKEVSNWPQLPGTSDVVGAKMTNQLDDSVQTTVHPFNIFGKIVSQSDNTEVSLQHMPNNNKVYFIGEGIHLPLNVNKNKDGSVQLTVDMDKMCKNCNSKTCETIRRQENLENETISDPATKTDFLNNQKVQNIS